MKKFENISKIINTLLGIICLILLVRFMLNAGTWMQNLSINLEYTDKTKFDVVAKCQQISSIKENPKWIYADCVEELSRMVPTRGNILFTI